MQEQSMTVPSIHVQKVQGRFCFVSLPLPYSGFTSVLLFPTQKILHKKELMQPSKPWWNAWLFVCFSRDFCSVSLPLPYSGFTTVLLSPTQKILHQNSQISRKIADATLKTMVPSLILSWFSRIFVLFSWLYVATFPGFVLNPYGFCSALLLPTLSLSLCPLGYPPKGDFLGAPGPFPGSRFNRILHPLSTTTIYFSRSKSRIFRGVWRLSKELGILKIGKLSSFLNVQESKLRKLFKALSRYNESVAQHNSCLAFPEKSEQNFQRKLCCT